MRPLQSPPQQQQQQPPAQQHKVSRMGGIPTPFAGATTVRQPQPRPEYIQLQQPGGGVRYHPPQGAGGPAGAQMVYQNAMVPASTQPQHLHVGNMGAGGVAANPMSSSYTAQTTYTQMQYPATSPGRR